MTMTDASNGFILGFNYFCSSNYNEYIDWKVGNKNQTLFNID